MSLVKNPDLNRGGFANSKSCDIITKLNDITKIEKRNDLSNDKSYSVIGLKMIN